MANATYKATITNNSRGIGVIVVPNILSFKATHETKLFVVTVAGEELRGFASTDLEWSGFSDKKVDAEEYSRVVLLSDMTKVLYNDPGLWKVLDCCITAEVPGRTEKMLVSDDNVLADVFELCQNQKCINIYLDDVKLLLDDPEGGNLGGSNLHVSKDSGLCEKSHHLNENFGNMTASGSGFDVWNGVDVGYSDNYGGLLLSGFGSSQVTINGGCEDPNPAVAVNFNTNGVNIVGADVNTFLNVPEVKQKRKRKRRITKNIKEINDLRKSSQRIKNAGGDTFANDYICENGDFSTSQNVGFRLTANGDNGTCESFRENAQLAGEDVTNANGEEQNDESSDELYCLSDDDQGLEEEDEMLRRYTKNSKSDHDSDHIGLSLDQWTTSKKINPDAYQYVDDLDEQTWARHAFSESLKCEHITNNISESFNSWVGDLRGKPVVVMYDTIRGRLMSKIHTRYAEATLWVYDVTPRVIKQLKANAQASRTLKFWCFQDKLFEVREENKSFVVKLDEGYCDCKEWNHTGIPYRTYNQTMLPVKDQSFWPEFASPQCLPPLTRRRSGRLTNKRKKSAHEEPMKRSSRGKCGKCGEYGHNTESQPNFPLTQSSQKNGSVQRPSGSHHSTNPSQVVNLGRNKRKRAVKNTQDQMTDIQFFSEADQYGIRQLLNEPFKQLQKKSKKKQDNNDGIEFLGDTFMLNTKVGGKKQVVINQQVVSNSRSVERLFESIRAVSLLGGELAGRFVVGDPAKRKLKVGVSTSQPAQSGNVSIPVVAPKIVTFASAKIGAAKQVNSFNEESAPRD
ncbi:OLC1v1035498C1 [Oldenlandia corymbosa var. corymbosa]|uniref:OLC1v1035498C1 n=1 Tax=Oldenlandia corymbosa var. corymbosa TaxID=529605 RepID=A0AAV1CTW0_OLDCO|nr:OLC1v1035498C1 [Oldenlandia corymbosa var. corymbosa]